MRIFFSWQSDRRENRNFIRSALDAAAKALHKELNLEEAEREITIDQDTQGLPGSPAIAESILSKILAADVFVADLTFIDDPESGITSHESRRTPNPNVMLEYGYALHALGDNRIIGVFNEAYGAPLQLPFDLAHRRWPITFVADGRPGERQAQKQRLTEALRIALRSVITQSTEEPRLETVAPFSEAEPGDGVGRLRHSQEYLCIGSADESKPIWLRPGPYMFLRLFPTIAIEPLGEVQAYKIAQSSLQPMGGMRSGRWHSGRHETGTVVYWTESDKPEHAWDAAELFLSGELWANDYYHVNPERERSKELRFPYLPMGAVEEVFVDTLTNFLSVARDKLNIAPPVYVVAGLADVSGFRLAVDARYFGLENFAGRIVRNNVVHEATLDDWNTDPFDFLRPFFEDIYDSAGIERPPVRTDGRRPLLLRRA